MDQCVDRWTTFKCHHIAIVHSCKRSERLNFQQGRRSRREKGDAVIFDHIYVKNIFQFMQQIHDIRDGMWCWCSLPEHARFVALRVPMNTYRA